MNDLYEYDKDRLKRKDRLQRMVDGRENLEKIKKKRGRDKTAAIGPLNPTLGELMDAPVDTFLDKTQEYNQNDITAL